MAVSRGIRTVSWAGTPTRRAALVVQLKGHGPVLLTLLAAMAWLASLHAIDLDRMNDLGLVSVFPCTVFLAMLAVIAGFCLTLGQRRPSESALFVHILVLIVMLYGVTALIEQEPRFPTVWTHAAIIEYILRTGHVNPGLSAYFNWPGFFILNALVTRVTGVTSILNLAAWAPLFFNLLYLGPLLMLLRAATSDRRVVWLGVWFFYLSNWIGQDYFSPQGLNYFFHLVILGVLLLYFKAPGRGGLFQRVGQRLHVAFPARLTGASAPLPGPDASHARGRIRQRVGLIAVVMALNIATVASHQLTPFATLASVSLLILFKCCTPRSLPLFMLITLTAWLSFMATAFLSGNLSVFTHDVGSVHNALSANLVNRLQGSPQHVFVTQMRVLMTLGVWAVAIMGALRRLRHGARDLPYMLLAMAPFPLLGLQTYGGEMLLRVYLFALPAVVFFMAALFYTRPTFSASWRTPGAVGLLSIALLGSFLFTRYGNERMDYFTPKEVAGVAYLYSIARPGAVFTGFTTYDPLPYRDFEKYDIETNLLATLREQHEDGALLGRGDVSGVIRAMRAFCPRTPYLLLTRSQVANMELFEGVSVQQVARLEQALAHADGLQMVYDNGDAAIYVLAYGGCRPHTLFGVPLSGGTAAPPRRAHTRKGSLFGVSV